MIKFKRQHLKEGIIYNVYLETATCFQPHSTFLLVEISKNQDLIVLEKDKIRTIPFWGYYGWKFQEITN